MSSVEQRNSKRLDFYFAEQPGPHCVGLRVVEQYDYSRSYRHDVEFNHELARPLQTLIWYPAKVGQAAPMTVRDYVNLMDTETSFGKPKLTARKRQWLYGMSSTLETALWSVRDAQPDSGPYPIVIYAPSHSNPSWENADLCEYLASYGYVVVASPSMGASSRGMTTDLAGINAQARDLSFLTGFAQTLPNTSRSGVAVIGFSWGGLSNVFAAARDDRIRALVCLDGSLRFSPGFARLAGDVHPEAMCIPLLSIAQGLWTPEDRARLFDRHPQHEGPDILNAWKHGDLTTVHMLGLSHMEHSAMLQRNENAWWNLLNVYRQKKAGYGRADGVIGYSWIVRYTLAFLNAYVKRDEAAAAFLKGTAAEPGAPGHFISVDFRAAAREPATLERLQLEIIHQGFERAIDVYKGMREWKPDFQPNEELLRYWAETLLDDGRLTNGIAILRLAAHIYPDSSAVYQDLGAAFRQAGSDREAMDYYRKALVNDPDNADAKRQLAELEVGASPPADARTLC